MFILKLAIVTCVVYMAITCVLFLATIALAHLKGSVGYDLNWRAFGLLFAFVWIVSFSVVWRIVFSRFAAGVS
jgi:hypothetical protein